MALNQLRDKQAPRSCVEVRDWLDNPKHLEKPKQALYRQSLNLEGKHSLFWFFMALFLN